MSAEISRALKRIRRRFDAQFFLEKLVVCLLAAGAIFVAAFGFAIFRRTNFSLTLESREWLAAAAFAPFFAAWIWMFARRFSLKETAARIDALAQTRDRFTTAFAFGNAAHRGAFENWALDECARFVAAFDARPFAPLRVPRFAFWLFAPVVAALLLAWSAHEFHQRHQPDPDAQRELSEKAAELEKLAKQIDAANQDAKSDELKKIAEALRKSMKNLREKTSAENPEDARKAALQELSSLQDQIAQMQKNQASPQELAALAEALKQSAAAKNAGDALSSGDAKKAAEELEKLSRENDKANAEKIAKAMQDAMQQLGANQQSALAQAMQNMAQSSDAQKALQRLAEALRKLGNNSSSQRNGSGGSSNQAALQAAMNALQDMKLGVATSDKSGNSQPSEKNGDGQNRVAVSSFDKKNGKPDAMIFDPSNPSGQPGSEHDEGTTKTPFGAQQKRTETDTKAMDLNGVLGEGESLQSLISTHGDASESTQKYRALYDAMLPAAEDALMQENIPPGSRIFVKRYFENIRPRE